MVANRPLTNCLIGSLITICMLLGCQIDQAETQVTAVSLPTQFPVAFSTPTAEGATATPEPELNPGSTAAAPTPAPELSPTVPASATPHPMFPYTLTGMKNRVYPGGEIQISQLLDENALYRRYAIDYPSDGLNITGTMNIPNGEGPFPVVILLHGYYPRDQYWPGAGTWQEADFFARRGYLAIAPDLRSWGGSDSGPSFFHMGLVADTINLISSLPSLPGADPQRIALWGHSMGGGIATKVLVIDQRPSAAILYAPNSAADADLIARWGPGCLPGQSEETGDKCNPADVVPQDLPQEQIQAYLLAAQDSQFLEQVSPIYHLNDITAPLQIHIGTADGLSLEQTPPDWSSKLFAALQGAGNRVEFFSYTDQGHFFQSQQWSQLMQRAVDFFNTQQQRH